MKQKIIDFFNDVAKEMKKVTWPSKEELKESTTVVIVASLVIAVVSWGLDVAISFAFKSVF